MRKAVFGAVAFAAALSSTYAFEREAQACGGCFTPPENPTVVTDHRMILSIAKEQSTLYDQIKYTGSPSAFAWVLPISGIVDVGLSADIVFQALDGVTATSIVPPPRNCPPPPRCDNDSLNASSGATQDASAKSPGGVDVLKQEVVGPYETVQLKAETPNALQNWLAQNGFTIPPDVMPVVNQYQTGGFNFLALKLLPGKNVQDMRPVRVTTQGANAVLPLRMVAAGTGAVVGISLWVIGEGRYEPQNYPSFAIPTDDIVWDWGQSRSNYTDLRTAKTAAANGRAWETESSTLLYRQQIESAVQRNYGGGYPYPSDPDQDAGDPDAGPIDPAEQYARIDYLPVKDAQGKIVKTAVQARTEDIATLFYGIPSASSRVTRIRADLAHAALNDDLRMTASADQAILSNVRRVTKELGQPQCPIFSPDGCSSLGTAPRDEAIARSEGSGGESFSCAVGSSSASPIWIGAGLGYAAIAFARARRRRRDAATNGK